MKTKTNLLHDFLPFLRWFPMTMEGVRADIIAGITVALLLVPQSMAYAQLAGLPVVYGLYASIVPVIIASMWGSCNQLHTAPVALLSMMSASALLPFALVGSEKFIELAIMLGLMVGVLRLILGLARLGVLVNFISNPVLIGFTNAAAIIIGLSQLNKIIGVPFPRSDSYVNDLWGVVSQINEIHWLTVAFAAGAYVVLRLTDRYMKRLPGVLIAVVLTTAVSAYVDFEHKEKASLDTVKSTNEAALIHSFDLATTQLQQITLKVSQNNDELLQLSNEGLSESLKAAQLQGEQVTLRIQGNSLKKENNKRLIDLYSVHFARVVDNDGMAVYYLEDHLPEGLESDGLTWHFASVEDNQAVFSAGGAVVGDIPQGLPSLSVPKVDLSVMLLLLPAAFIMALIGFLEATSISRAIAVKTNQKTDVNKELVGQGLANISGSFFGSFTVSGSFSRSAVAAKTGAQTGLFAIVSALAVVLVLLFLTPLLYHLPQAVLALIVMMAVFGLIRIKPLVHAWRVDRAGAVIGIVAFVSTLSMAPAIANGIMVGIVLTMIAFVFRVVKPRAEVLGYGSDGALTGMKVNDLPPISECFIPIRFDGSILFANVAYFENAIQSAHADFPDARTILVMGGSINWIDASGEDKIRVIATNLRKVGVTLAFCSLKKQVINSFARGGLNEVIGEDNIFRTKAMAIELLTERHDKFIKERQAELTTKDDDPKQD